MCRWFAAKEEVKINLDRNEFKKIILIPGTKPGKNPVWIPSLLVLTPSRIIIKYKKKRIIQGGVRTRREGIHTGFLPGLVPGINIIFFNSFLSRFFYFFLFFFFFLGNKSATHLSLSVINSKKPYFNIEKPKK